MADPIKIEGLREFQAKLKALDGESQKKLRLVFNHAAEIVAAGAKRLSPVKTGHLRASIKPQSGQREAKVVEGNAKVPYAGFIDFGGHVGKGRVGTGTGSVVRPFFKEGRMLYPSYYAHRPEVERSLIEGLNSLIKEVGLD